MKSVLLLITILITITTVISQKIINIAFFYPRNSQELAESERGLEAVVEYGIQKVSQKSGFLDGYTINMTHYNSGCSQTIGNRAYIEMLQSTERNSFILGPACSPAANPIARDVSFKNIHIVSYSASSTELSDNTTFRNFFRVIPSELVLVEARVNFVKKQGWSRVGIISNVDSLFSATASKITTLLTAANINTELFLYVTIETIPTIVQRIVDESYSVLIGNYYAADAVLFLCEFYKRERFSPSVTWLILGWYPTDFWNTTTTDCTPEQLRKTLDYAVSFVSYPSSLQPSAPTFLGPSLIEFRSIFNTTVALEMFIFDSFATIALALDSYEKNYRNLCMANASYCLENFDYGSRGISDLIGRELLNTNFLGVTGQIQFDGVGDRIANATVSQWFNGVPGIVGLSYESGILEQNGGVKWPGGVVPSDGIEYQQDSIGLIQFIITGLIAATAFILSVVYIILTAFYWKRKVIQAYQPTLTIVMLIGTQLLYIFIILEGLQNLTIGSEEFIVGTLGYDIICNFNLWLGFIGFGLTYGPIFLRTLEALYIVEYKIKRPMAKKKFVLKPVYLIAALAVYIIAVIAYLVIWTANSSTRLKLVMISRQVEIDRIPTIISTPLCGSLCQTCRQIIIGILLGVNCVLLTLGMSFVILTKDLKYKGLNDSVYIGVSVYSLVIFGAFAFGASEILELSVTIRYSITAFSLVIGLIVVSTLMVIPKLIIVWKDKNEVNEYGVVPLLKSHLSDNDFAGQYRRRIDTLEAENIQLRKQIKGSSVKKESFKKRTSLSRETDEKLTHSELVNIDEFPGEN
ncbi:gamma-aminobutyric acid (GABA) type B receptor [Oopsacas minuta]|uniref:Gamma-aminobutyric acid (GABA) type B receptor n=1 Tax=Oopsacas minuta TaxID=111878 RepID=A0AAV7JZ37_9METZ|nr:gamma-aminobutyric acid (GABA) type B receptor [Oopsacas minuta]